MSETDELAQKLARRTAINEGEQEPTPQSQSKVVNVYTEFKEFSRKEIKDFEKMFKKYDIDNDKFINFEELKHMMEKLESPQTHLSLKEMIKIVDEDQDGQISFREFLLIFRKAAAGELEAGSGLSELARLTEIDVDKEGVKGAANFFSAKIDEQSRSNKFEEEIKAEQEERKKLDEEKRIRQQAFKEKQSQFLKQL